MLAQDSSSDHRVLRQLLETTQEGFWFIDNDTQTLDVNPAMCAILGCPREEIIGRPIFDFVDQANAEIFRKEIAARRRGVHGNYEIALRRPDGSNVPCINNATPLFDDDGQKIASIGLWTDISGLKQAEAALRAAHDQLEQRVEARTAELAKINDALQSSEEQLRLVIDALPATIAYFDKSARYRLVNKMTGTRFGLPVAEILGKHLGDVVGEENDRRLRPYYEAALAGQAQTFESTVDQPDGMSRQIEISYLPHEGPDREIVGFFALGIDVTERRQLEEQLKQAQKMEAIGQLTGGVAHDFNNLLAVIMGNAELLESQLGPESGPASAILQAATRGAELTQRLLAYSRLQPLRPRAVDLGTLVSNMSGLLTRTLGETIEIESSAAPDLWGAMADPGQVENALLNLALNARDAMPGGGRLTIECANASLDDSYVAENAEAVAGDYVVLAVTDNGAGMPAEIQAQAFEPFFTTKEVGQGSGLGLSMVYGFAKQSGGHIAIYSEEGRGTTVKLYLPRTETAGQRKDARQEHDVPQGRGEMVLVIEDDPDVRDLAVQMLEGLGYRVIKAADAAAAHAALADGAAVDLVLSDVVLPGGTSGPQFAEQARASYPDLKVIFMSGYPAEAATRNGALRPDEVLLSKPFRKQQLATALRQALD